MVDGASDLGGDRSQLSFVDDFTNRELARFYDTVPGVGQISRRSDGLHYVITHGPDGPTSTEDHLTIDSLGRPQSPTSKVVLKFLGTNWSLDVHIAYNFETKMNGRHAYFWLVLGDTAQRLERSTAFVRSADLEPPNGHLSFLVHTQTREPISRILTHNPQRLNWFRISRSNDRMNAEWSEDGNDFTRILEWNESSAPAYQTVVIDSSSFAGGAPFSVRHLRIVGSHPVEAQSRPPLFSIAGSDSTQAEVNAEEVVAALNAGRDVSLVNCAIQGAFDLAQATVPISSNIRIHQCDFKERFVASSVVTVFGRGVHH